MNKTRRFALSALAVGAALALGACRKSAGEADVFLLAQQAQGLRVGPADAKVLMYVFFDPVCPHCAHLWTEARQLVDRVGQVWIPVSVLRGSNANVAAALLGSADPSTALDEHADAVLRQRPLVARAVSGDLTSATSRNSELFKKTLSDSVPLVVYRQEPSGQVLTRTGSLSAAELSSFLGLPGAAPAMTRKILA